MEDTGCVTDADCAPGERCAPSTGSCLPEVSFPSPPDLPEGTCEPGATRFCGTKVGACRYGTEACVDGEWSGVCEDAVTPTLEICDGDDNDCNGATDEAFPDLGQVCEAGVGECKRTGNQVCGADGLEAVCNAIAAAPTTTEELCGGDPDEDCDGEEEEGFTTRGEACTQGQGICARVGFLRCTADRTALECSVTPGPAAPTEICDGLRDDDCDGGPDEVEFPLLGTACEVGAPPCTTAGTYQCKADGTGVECIPDVPVGAEALCNQLDDDQDGCIDDGFPVGASCAVGVGQCRQTGARICSADSSGTVCDATPLAGNPAERCDYIDDDDCDGISETDEFPTRDRACSVGVGACAATGQYVCNADGSDVVCDAVPLAPGVELCGNNKDDDCDGLSDAEEFPNLGQSCSVGIGACQRTGQWTCDVVTGTIRCSANPGSPQPERCDGVDQNCNLLPDDGCDDDGDDYCDANMAWTAGATAVCPNTTSLATRDCNDENLSIHPGAEEICFDGNLDSNCDGNPDDGCNTCVRGTDSDLDGSDDCDDCAPRNGAIYPGATEVCDGLDNDCVGGPDDPFDADGDQYTTCGTILPGGGLDPGRIDCNDNDPQTFPGACELCKLGESGPATCNQPNDRGDGIDQDCDGYPDDTCEPCDSSDADNDGYSDCEGDCADDDPNVTPVAAEVCDGKDTDCNRNTRENCGVGDACNHDGGDQSNDPDVCQEELFCVESLSAMGTGTGEFSCTSLCNFSETGFGIGDGCQSDEVCTVNLTPTTNQYGCAKAVAFGTAPTGSEVTDIAMCRSGMGYETRRVMGTRYFECTDHCASDDYCANGTVCTSSATGVNDIWIAECRTPTGSRGLGQDCSTSASSCRSGFFSCLTVDTNIEICSQACCANEDCPNGYFCKLDAVRFTGAAGPGAVDTLPMCWPDSDTGPRRAGTACSANDQCISGFCDVNLNICIETCCNDQVCASINPTTTCEIASVVLPVMTGEANGITFTRACLSQTPADSLEAMP